MERFKNNYTEFTPTSWVEIDKVARPLLFKVVTEDLKSLGLRKNPNIMTFEIGTWAISSTEIKAGNSDIGGIWCALKISGAKTLRKYMYDQYRIKTKIFKTTVDLPLYSNSYRVKSRAVYLIEEIE